MSVSDISTKRGYGLRKSNIDCILASGKSTALNPAHKFQFREVGIDGENKEVAMITFRHDG